MRFSFCQKPAQALDLPAYIIGTLQIGTISSLAASVRVFLLFPSRDYISWDTVSDAVTGEIVVEIAEQQSDLLRAGGVYRICVINMADGSLEAVTANGIAAESISVEFVGTCPIPEPPHTIVLIAPSECDNAKC